MLHGLVLSHERLQHPYQFPFLSLPACALPLSLSSLSDPLAQKSTAAEAEASLCLGY